MTTSNRMEKEPCTDRFHIKSINSVREADDVDGVMMHENMLPLLNGDRWESGSIDKS